MVSQAEFDLFVESQRGVRRLALRDLLIKSGAKYEPKVWPSFPELHSVD